MVTEELVAEEAELEIESDAQKFHDMVTGGYLADYEGEMEEVVEAAEEEMEEELEQEIEFIELDNRGAAYEEAASGSWLEEYIGDLYRQAGTEVLSKGVDNLKYLIHDAVRGRIYQDAYIYTGPLSDEEVYTLNEIFGIE